MELTDLFSRALESGCQRSLEQLLTSDDYRDLVARFSTPSTDEDLAEARRVGHEQFGLLLSTLTETTAVAAARQTENGPPVSPAVMAALQLTGQSLIEAAVGCLPDIILQIADAWQSASADEQLILLRGVYSLFRETGDYAQANRVTANTGPELAHSLDEEAQEVVDVRSSDWNIDSLPEITTTPFECDAVEITSERIIVDFRAADLDVQASETTVPAYDGPSLGFEWLDRYSKTYTGDEALPSMLGKWCGDGQISPSCLGLSIILAAFAHLTHAPYLHVYQLEDHAIEAARFRGRSANNVLSDLDERQLGILPEHRQYEQVWINQAEGLTQTAQAAHYAVAIRLSDSRWVHVDPYLGNFGVFQDCWELEEKYRVLLKYQTVLPGLSLIGHDNGALRAYFDAVAVRQQTLMVASVSLQQAWHEARLDESVLEGYDGEDYMGWMPDSFDFDAHCEDTEAAILLDTIQGGKPYASRSFDTKVYAYGFDDTDIFKTGLSTDQIIACIQARQELFVDDPEFEQQCLERFWTLFHLSAIDLATDALKLAPDSGEFVNPALEFALPTYSIGLAVVNQLRCWTEPLLSGKLLLGYASSQYYWQCAADISRDEAVADDPRILWSEAIVRQLPEHHPSVNFKLQYLDHYRKEQYGQDRWRAS